MKNKIVFAFLVMFAFCRAALAGFQADVSRTVIPEGESFQLYLRQDGDAAQPDISVLNEDFLIVMERKSFKSTYVNGKTQTFNENVLTLIPKKTGEVTLPSIRAGKEQTKPLKLTVVAGGQALPDDPADRKKAQAAQPNVFIRYTVDNQTPYVGQQVPLSVKLYSFVQTPLLDGAVTPPQADGITAEQWGDVKRSRETVNGRTYDVLEYKFLLFAQKSGRITLSPVRFRGTISDPEGRDETMEDLFGFGGSDFFSGFFGQKNIAVQSSAVVLDIRPKPDQAGTGIWLPATDVAVSEDFTPPKQTISLGEALTRTVTVMAAGVRDSQIPDLAFPDGTDYKQYPGKTDSKNLFDNNGIVGVKTRQIVFMPTKAGQIVLPRMEIPWFDVKSKQIKKAVLPARTITVTGAESKRPAEPPVLPAAAADSGAAAAAPAVPPSAVAAESEFAKAFSQPPENTAEQKAAAAFWEKYVHQPPLRLFLAGILAGGAVVTVLWLLLHFLIFKKAAGTKPADGQDEMPQRREAVSRIKEACLSGSAEQAKRALLDLGRVLWAQNPPLTLSELAGRFDNKELSEQMENLNRALYAGNAAGWDAKTFWTVFKKVETGGKKQKKNEKIPVPPLYPD